MRTFPDIIPPDYSGYTESVYCPVIRSEFEDNTVRLRPRAAGKRRKFALRWGSMPDADYRKLKEFFTGCSGAMFNWINPLDNESIHVVFASDTLSASAVGYAPAKDGGRSVRWRVDVELEEITPLYA